MAGKTHVMLMIMLMMMLVMLMVATCLGDKCKSVLVDNRLHLNPLPGFHHHDHLHDEDKYDGN